MSTSKYHIPFLLQQHNVKHTVVHGFHNDACLSRHICMHYVECLSPYQMVQKVIDFTGDTGDFDRSTFIELLFGWPSFTSIIKNIETKIPGRCFCPGLPMSVGHRQSTHLTVLGSCKSNVLCSMASFLSVKYYILKNFLKNLKKSFFFIYYTFIILVNPA